MRVLIDAHVLLWAVDNPGQLSETARLAIQDSGNELLVSAGTIWEIAIKVGLGKLTLSIPYRQWIERTFADLEAAVLPISVVHADRQITLPHHHRDPFDRLLIAQSLQEAAPLVSMDAQLDIYGITRLW